ncbi:YfhD family protein [Paenibacillus sambharensis]|nr:YfhD family protein [Paenibacillus sambharensis]
MTDNKPDYMNRKLPVAKAEDVEYSEELADMNDREARARAEAADRRAERS